MNDSMSATVARGDAGIPIGVTGSTGALGGQVARLLADAGRAQRLLARSPERVPVLPNTSVVRAAYDDGPAAETALRGIRTLLMVSASESADRLDQHRRFVDAAREAGVQHVVYTSFQGAAPDATFTLARDHYGTEQHIRQSGMRFTFLRDSFYLDFFPALVGDDGVIRGPAGHGRVAAVARADVARTAAVILQDPDAHVGATYDLTGQQALTFDEVAEILTEHTGRQVRFHDETLEEAYASRAVWGAPDWQNDAWVSTYTAIAAGELAPISTSVEDITGRAPLTLREYLREGDARA